MKKGVLLLFLLTLILVLCSVHVLATNVTACGTLNSANTVYDLQNNVTTTGVCFTLSATNITLDGHGYTITGDRSNDGVYVTSSAGGSTVKNFYIYNVSYGIYLPSGSNYQVLNNFINTTVNVGIYLPSSINSTIANNTILLTSRGIYIPGSANITLVNNVVISSQNQGIYAPSSPNAVFINNTIYFSGAEGLYVSNTRNSTIANNTIFNNSASGLYGSAIPNSTIQDNTLFNNKPGLTVYTSLNVTIRNNRIYSNNDSGFFIFDSDNSVIINNTIFNNTNSGLNITLLDNNLIMYNTLTGNNGGILLTQSNDTTLIGNTIRNNSQMGISINDSANITFTNSSIASTDFSLYDLFVNNVTSMHFTDRIIIGNYSIINTTLSLENKTYGVLTLLTLRTASGINFTTGINFDGNYLFFNSSYTLLNTSANISLYGTPGVGKTNHIITRDGSRCSDCSNFTSLSETIVIFNTTQPGAYSIASGPAPTSSTSSSSGSSNRGSSHSSGSSGTIIKTAPKLLVLTSDELASGSTYTLKAGDQLSFEAGSKQAETHTLTLDTIHKDSIDITVASTPQTLTFMQGTSKTIDLDGDLLDDITVDCTLIDTNEATLTLTAIQQPFPVPTETAPVTEPVVAEPTNSHTGIIIGIVIAVIVVVGIIFLRKRK